jgi:hypothetical protein
MVIKNKKLFPQNSPIQLVERWGRGGGGLGYDPYFRKYKFSLI